MKKLLIYSPKQSNRLSYILEVILSNMLALEWQVTSEQEAYITYLGPKLNYSATRLTKEEIHFPPQGLLFETTVRPHQPEVDCSGPFPVLYPHQDTKADYIFDPFSMCFYLLSRYEEYLPYTPDVHGRFPAKASLAYRHGFLQLPVINMWLASFRKCLLQYFPDLQLPVLPFHFQATYDIDLAWAFKHRTGGRNLLGAAKDGLKMNGRQLILRLQVLRGLAEDPFDTYDFLQSLHQEYDLPAHFFFLLGDYSQYDKNIHPDHPALLQLIRLLGEKHQLGIHPSYRSNNSDQQLIKEIKRLEAVLEKPVVHSRQHYLKLHLPTTYQNLVAGGIQHDYSMGYAAEIGFRAGIAHSFRWYDLSKEITTDLTIHPFQVMDVTLKNYLKLDAEEALGRILPMMESVKLTGGTFSTLWHNSSFSEIMGWHGWREMYRKLLAKGKVFELKVL